MNIIFIEPKSPNLHLFSRFKLPRLGCVLLATIASERGHQAKVFVEEIGEIDWDAVRGADLVGISTITSTAPRAYELADRVRRMGKTVVMGGPHATYLPTEAAGRSDFVLRGEAEVSFMQLLEHLEGNRAFDEVGGCCRLEDGKLVTSTTSLEPVDLESNPAPNFNLVHRFKDASTFRMVGQVIPMQVSRGCPHDCSFCSVTGMFGRKMRYRSVDSVMSELARYDDKRYHIFFYDDNFSASPKRAKALLSAMAAAKTKFSWSTQLRAEAAIDDELLNLMRKTHCDTVYVGIESVNPESLKQARKRQNLDETSAYLRKFKRHGVSVHGMFVLGFDADSEDAWKHTVRFARKARISTIQALILTPLPGSRTYEQFIKEGRILFKDWSLYDSHHVVFQHPSMTGEALQNAQIDAHLRFYSKWRLLRHFLSGHVAETFIFTYARGLQKSWVRANNPYMKMLELLRVSKDFRVDWRCLTEPA